MAVGSISMLAGCASTPSPILGPSVAQYYPELAQTPFENPSAYTDELGPFDVISLNVFREPDLSVDRLTVSSQGKISLPLIGEVDASGRSPEELSRYVESRLSDGYLRSPHVSVNILTIASRKITIEGSVTRPGLFDLLPHTKLSGALAMAQGPSRVAKLNQIAVFRETEDGIYVARFDYNMLASGEMADPLMMPGDRVVVGVSALAQGWQDFLRTVPLIGVFQRFTN